MIQDFYKYFNHIKNNLGHKDNDERSVFSVPPCSVCTEEFTKDDIDDPPFEDGDWREFWRLSKQNFPLHSVCGGAWWITEGLITNNEEDNMKTHLKLMYKRPKLKNKRVLEIGYGFGGAGLFLIKEGADYKGIDYVSSNPELPKDKFLEIEKSGIPDEIKNGKKVDIVYSYNVFQHLTQEQRFEYIKESHDLLKSNGVLFFSVFERIPGQGLRENYSTTFFNVHTKVDEPEELQEFLSNTGFTFERSVNSQLCDETNNVIYVCRKKSV